MGDEESGMPEEARRSDPAGGGFSILLGEESIRAFMGSGDFSSARELDRFMELGARIEGRLAEEGSRSIIALSVGENRLSRDFTVLQMAHILAKHGRDVLIVDCDFLSPGLSGIVENIEDHGYLDLLLYGSSLKTVARPTGIDGVRVIGSGSFPISRTIPFAKKEFLKVRDFLNRNNDVIIYCSTLYTDDGTVNPLASLVDSIILSCRIEEMPEGQLRKSLGDLSPDLPPADLVCFGEDGDISPKGDDRSGIAAETVGPAQELSHDESGKDFESGHFEPAAIEKTADLESGQEHRGGGISLPRLVIIVVAVFVGTFLIWWFLIHKSISDKERESRTAELVHKQLDVKEMKDRTQDDPLTEEDGSVVVDKEHIAGSEPVVTPAAEEAESGEDAGSKDLPTTAEQADGGTGTVGEGGSEGSPSVTLAPEGSYYAIHVASFKDISRAGSETAYLEKKDYPSTVITSEVKGQIWYRVYVGEFETLEEAEAARIRLLEFSRIGYARIVTLDD